MSTAWLPVSAATWTHFCISTPFKKVADGVRCHMGCHLKSNQGSLTPPARDVRVWFLGSIVKWVYELKTKILWNTFWSNFGFIQQIRPQFCSWHDTYVVVACAKVWPDLIIVFHGKVSRIFKRFMLWVHTELVKWIPGSILLAFTLLIIFISLQKSSCHCNIAVNLRKTSPNEIC